MKQTVRLRITTTDFRKHLYKRTTYTNLKIRRVDPITNEDINNFLPIKISEILYLREKNNNLKHKTLTKNRLRDKLLRTL